MFIARQDKARALRQSAMLIDHIVRSFYFQPHGTPDGVRKLLFLRYL